MDSDDMDMDFEDMDMDMDSDDMDMDSDDMDMDMDSDEDEMTEEVVYEIYMDDDMDDMDSEEEEEEVDESIAGKRKRYNRYSGSAHHPTNESKSPKFLELTKKNKVLQNKVSGIQSENEQLKEDYNKMVDALKQFRTKLNEVAVFNSNLTYAVRLFTENTTTKEEKVDIIKRFDDVKSLKESKNVYRQLINEISKKSPIKESIDEKLNVTKTSGSAETKINESQVYVNPELEKMKKLWGYDYKK
jgi:hypothetical protein